MKLPNPYEKVGDYYAVLGVPKEADKAFIRRAYRRKLKEAHGDAEAKTRIQFASDALSKSESRARTDLVSFWESRGYEEVLNRYAEQGLTLSLSEDWAVRRAFTEATERDALGSMVPPPSPRVSWKPVEKYSQIPTRGAKLGEMEK